MAEKEKGGSSRQKGKPAGPQGEEPVADVMAYIERSVVTRPPDTEPVTWCIYGERVRLSAQPALENSSYTWLHKGAGRLEDAAGNAIPSDVVTGMGDVYLETAGAPPGQCEIKCIIQDGDQRNEAGLCFYVADQLHQGESRVVQDAVGRAIADAANAASGNARGLIDDVSNALKNGFSVALRRPDAGLTSDVAFWIVIRRSTRNISFTAYQKVMDKLLCNINFPYSNGNGRQLPPELSWWAEQFEPPGTLGNTAAQLESRRYLPFNDTDAYRFLKVATEAFLITGAGAALGTSFRTPFTPEEITHAANRLSVPPSVIDPAQMGQYLETLAGPGPTGTVTIPYLALVRNKLQEAGIKRSFFSGFAQDTHDISESCYGILQEKLASPLLLELIWSYWHEEGMLVQTMNALTRRFQNIHRPGDRDPLAALEIDPLRPLNNLLWGHIQDEQHRLTLVRRAYEYDHHYGLSLYGKAVPQLRPADSRSRFLEAFHNLLYRCHVFFQHDDETTVIADAFPVLNALQEVHLLLSQGAHNQFGDLPVTARQEMLMQQWLLARPEFREFLPSRIMVAYPEPWMDRVDAMKTLQGWTDSPVLHFRNLAMFGEQILLSVRYGNWNNVTDSAGARNWVRFWREEIQGYIHAYRAVTSIDLDADVADTRLATERYLQPSVHLRHQLEQQHRGLPRTGKAVPELNGAAPVAGRLASAPNGMIGVSNGAVPAGRSLPTRR
jgi:hypothetical protein